MSRPSDYLLVACLIAGIVFTLVFSLGRPHVWYRDPLGWVIFLYSIAVDALLFLIVYGIAFGQPVDEVYRFTIAALLLGTLFGKTAVVHMERAAGRQPFSRPARTRKKVRT